MLWNAELRRKGVGVGAACRRVGHVPARHQRLLGAEARRLPVPCYQHHRSELREPPHHVPPLPLPLPLPAFVRSLPLFSSLPHSLPPSSLLPPSSSSLFLLTPSPLFARLQQPRMGSDPADAGRWGRVWPGEVALKLKSGSSSRPLLHARSACAADNEANLPCPGPSPGARETV